MVVIAPDLHRQRVSAIAQSARARELLVGVPGRHRQPADDRPGGGRRSRSFGGYVHVQARSATTDIARLVGCLPVPQPFTLRRFAHMVGRQRGKAIHLLDATLGATAPCGLLVTTTEVDYICYASNTSWLHQLHIILHEVGHLVLGHAGGSHAAPVGTRRVFGRNHYDAAVERDAEVFATLGGCRIAGVLGSGYLDLPPDSTVLELGTLFDAPAPRGAGDG